MEATERTFTSWKEWAKERYNKDGKRNQDLYKELIRKLAIFTGKVYLDYPKEEAMELPEDWIEESYNRDRKNCKPYSELDDNEKKSYICNHLCKVLDNIPTYPFYFTWDGIPVEELQRQNKERELNEKEKSFKQNCLKMIDKEKFEELAEKYYDPCAKADLKERKKDRHKSLNKLLNENKINSFLKDEYKSNDIKAHEKIEKRLNERLDRFDKMNKINDERWENPFGKGEKRFKNIPDCVIVLFDWLLDKVNKDGTYKLTDLKNDKWEVLAPKDKELLLGLLPQIKEYPDLELSCEDIQDIELKLTEPRLFRLKKIQKMVEDVLNLPQEKIEEYLSILDKLDKMYNLSVKVSEEIERLKKEEGEAEMRRQVDSAIASVMRQKEHAKEQ